MEGLKLGLRIFEQGFRLKALLKEKDLQLLLLQEVGS